MAISRGGFRLLLEESHRKPFQGSVLELGRNTVYLTLQEVQEWADRHSVQLHPTPCRLSNLTECAEAGCIDDTTLFSSLGFSTVHSCDISEAEHPTFEHDLNNPVPESLHEQYDVIIDSGTTEHIFDLQTVLGNIHKMLKVGGRAIFMTVPASNYVDHGYYMFSPQLFFDYYCVNKYSIVSSYLIFFKRDFLRDPWMVYQYYPGVLDSFSYGCMPNDMMVSFWLCVEKRPDSLCTVIPQQGCSRPYLAGDAIPKVPEFICQI
ncbi:MAG: class I SAM-dependent methyltransferase [Deltaproteobacteria bacterium]|nr:class I SAM-dependent methyltransferase [Deltaproteobacteria bacterium]